MACRRRRSLKPITSKPRSALIRKFSSDPVRIQLVGPSSVTARFYEALERSREAAPRKASTWPSSGGNRFARPRGEGGRPELLVFRCRRVKQITRAVRVGFGEQPAAHHQAARRIERSPQLEPALARLLDRGRARLGV